MFGQIRPNHRKLGSMFGHTRNQLVHPASGAEDERQQMGICYASSLEKSTLLLEIRKTSGSYVEPSDQCFWAECSDKEVSSQYLRPNIQPIYQLRDALWANDALREQFVAENPAQLPAADLALVASWQYRLADSFYIFRSFQHSTVFLSTTTPAHAYGVLGLASTIEETVPLPLPVYTQAVFLPFEHHIIYDSLLTSYNVIFGPGIRHDLQERYRNIQEREGIITSLLLEDQAAREANQRTDMLARTRKV